MRLHEVGCVASFYFFWYGVGGFMSRAGAMYRMQCWNGICLYLYILITIFFLNHSIYPSTDHDKIDDKNSLFNKIWSQDQQSTTQNGGNN